MARFYEPLQTSLEHVPVPISAYDQTRIDNLTALQDEPRQTLRDIAKGVTFHEPLDPYSVRLTDVTQRREVAAREHIQLLENAKRL